MHVGTDQDSRRGGDRAPHPHKCLSVVSLLLELATEKEITCALVYRKLPRKKGAWAEIMCF